MRNIFFLGLMLVGELAFGQSGAKIEFKHSDNTIDFGTVFKDNDSGLRSFEFVNNGDADLVISSVNATCGCVVAGKPNGVIAPGRSGVIDIKCSLTVGTMRKTIVVESNAVNVDNGVVKLAIKGEILGN